MRLTGVFLITGGNILYKDKTVSAIILIAGSSSRFHSEINKNLLEINNKPIFLYSLDIFNSNKYIDDIFVVVRETDRDEVMRVMHDFHRRQAYLNSCRRKQ